MSSALTMALETAAQPVLLIEDQPQRSDGASEYGGKRNVEDQSFVFQRSPACPCFLDSLLGEVYVRPAGEQISEVPVTLAVAYQDQRSELFLGVVVHGGRIVRT